MEELHRESSVTVNASVSTDITVTTVKKLLDAQVLEEL